MLQNLSAPPSAPKLIAPEDFLINISENSDPEEAAAGSLPSAPQRP